MQEPAFPFYDEKFYHQPYFSSSHPSLPFRQYPSQPFSYQPSYNPQQDLSKFGRYRMVFHWYLLNWDFIDQKIEVNQYWKNCMPAGIKVDQQENYYVSDQMFGNVTDIDWNYPGVM
ncbi:hypothetical protein [Fictibacillus sp. FJAT-27399]|uniref:hypothetical protein n=1 Tax=Fictibacillus sp. FJAT-27399 TaxID=1729689 RepID=UPI00078059F7|nr:hypothetical protein [Fictibacillus sp. FJAT-27399]